uniref:Uncharacterized protein n=1 Tax=Anguilla anguilla TaxID=7936 RepID=A0A0E9QFU9_ANGAN
MFCRCLRVKDCSPLRELLRGLDLILECRHTSF